MYIRLSAKHFQVLISWVNGIQNWLIHADTYLHTHHLKSAGQINSEKSANFFQYPKISTCLPGQVLSNFYSSTSNLKYLWACGQMLTETLYINLNNTIAHIMWKCKIFQGQLYHYKVKNSEVLVTNASMCFMHQYNTSWLIWIAK